MKRKPRASSGYGRRRFPPAGAAAGPPLRARFLGADSWGPKSVHRLSGKLTRRPSRIDRRARAPTNARRQARTAGRGPWRRDSSAKSRRCATKGRPATTRSAIAITRPLASFSARPWPSICAPPSATGTTSPGRAPTCSARRPSSGPGRGETMAAARLKADVGLRLVHAARRAVLHLPRPRRRPRGREPRRIRRATSRAMADMFRGEDAGDRRQAAVGHGQPVQPPPLHGGRGDQSRSRRVRLRRRAGEERASTPPTAGRRQLRAVGRPRGLRDPAQHRPRSASSNQLGRFLSLVVEYKHKIGFKGAHPDRAQAAGADQAPVRLRRRHRATASCSATAWRRRSRSTSRSTTPCWPATASSTRSRSPPRSASSARSTPTAATTSRAGTPTSSPTTPPNWSRRCITSCKAGGLAHRRLQLRRQGAPPVDRPGRPAPRPHRRPRRLRAGARSRRRAMIEDGKFDAFSRERYAGWDAPEGAGDARPGRHARRDRGARRRRRDRAEAALRAAGILGEPGQPLYLRREVRTRPRAPRSLPFRPAPPRAIRASPAGPRCGRRRP